MKKRLFACLLAACLAVSVLVLPASAASLNNSAIQTAITLGAMDTSQTGSLDAAVTRGAFAKMLVSFSAYRESASQQGNLGTLYKDVPGSSQWAPYVRIAVQQGWKTAILMVHSARIIRSRWKKPAPQRSSCWAIK